MIRRHRHMCRGYKQLDITLIYNCHISTVVDIHYCHSFQSFPSCILGPYNIDHVYYSQLSNKYTLSINEK